MSNGSIRQMLSRIKNPIRVVNCCFSAVLLLSLLLSWRVAVVLERAYIGEQLSGLEGVASTVDRQFQRSVDNLLFYRSTMHYALQSPASTDKVREAIRQFDARRTDPDWMIRLDQQRGLPIYGVSDGFVEHHPPLTRDFDDLDGELTATLELSYILQLADYSRDFQRRVFYVSRAGYYMSTSPLPSGNRSERIMPQILDAAWFGGNREHVNRSRGVIWTASIYPLRGITASVPLDMDMNWYGVLGMDFSLDSIHAFLLNAIHNKSDGTILLFNRHFDQIASSAFFPPQNPLFSQAQMHQLSSVVSGDQMEGYVRMGSRFVSWAKLKSYDGVLVKIHTLREGIKGEFGNISSVLLLLGVLCSVILMVSWYVMLRLVSSMIRLQGALSWRANFDTLTRLYNRGAFYDSANRQMKTCREQHLPLSVIQMDLDHFKWINDEHGHSTGDKVLAHTGATIMTALRSADVAGRVGGEEFCILLPGVNLADAGLVAERIRQRISSKELLVHAGTTIRITASFGVSCTTESGPDDFTHLQNRADKRLYYAKTHGRDQVCTGEPPPTNYGD
ncbi:cellulose biosynthesis regulator YedQ [Shimwellia pseudoproteus]|uniref:cellulose biosynthesis regulator diguanylate cyclase DgcQ n=1 Tax=Shimwellia pseudoproteus TaxID=570012 RepID=UPI0018EE0563|nr:cellulose biosynthesis regulator YedQ [Shimwellia pseudoproteus]